jgi:hypothetical protein
MWATLFKFSQKKQFRTNLYFLKTPKSVFIRVFSPLYVFYSNYTSGLVNYWPVLSTSTPVVDLFTGLAMTSTTPTRALDRLSSASDAAIGVRGTLATYWTLPPASYFSGDFTIIGWVRMYSCSDEARFVDCGSGAGIDNVLFILNRYSTCCPVVNLFSSTTASGNLISSYSMPTNGQWVHLAWSVTGTTAQVYANGSSIYSNGYVMSPRNTTRTNCYIGQSNWPANTIANADFDEINFYKRGLSHAEIQYDLNSIKSFVGTI